MIPTVMSEKKVYKPGSGTGSNIQFVVLIHMKGYEIILACKSLKSSILMQYF